MADTLQFLCQFDFYHKSFVINLYTVSVGSFLNFYDFCHISVSRAWNTRIYNKKAPLLGRLNLLLCRSGSTTNYRA